MNTEGADVLAAQIPPEDLAVLIVGITSPEPCRWNRVGGGRRGEPAGALPAVANRTEVLNFRAMSRRRNRESPREGWASHELVSPCASPTFSRR